LRGRKAKPTARKKLEGNPGKRKLNKREPRPKASERIAAAEIDRRAHEFIAAYAPQLQAMGLLTDADQAALELMSVHYSIAWRAAEIVTREGLMLKNAFGWAKHPLLQVLRDNSTAFKSYAAEFGLTPSSRSRISVPEPLDDDRERRQLEMELFGPAAKVVKSE
jgi:P27 family predicted phage terminase small subunit